MATVTNVEIGSVVSGMVPNIPVGISGILLNIVNNQIYFSEQFLDQTIGTSAIAEMYQPAITTLSAANVLELMESQGVGTKAVSIGELSISKGIVDGTSKSLREVGMVELNALLDNIGEQVLYYQTFS